MKKNKRINIILAIVGLFICGFIYQMAHKVMFEDLITYTDVLPDQHELFNYDAQKKLKFTGGSKTKGEQPSSNYIYDEKYTISIFKCLSNNEAKLADQIHLLDGGVQNIDGFYTSGGNDDLKIKYKDDRIDSSSSLYINYEGELLNRRLEGNLFCTQILFDEYSLSYDNDRLILKADAKRNNSQVCIAVIKKSNFLYIINMTPYTSNIDIDQNMLCNLLEK